MKLAKMIDGEVYKDMILQAAAALEERMEETNALNVFPVPDGDTGTNMSMTLNSAVAELNKLESPTLGRALEVTSSALLRGARGNSGVITSLLFRGMGKAMKDCRTADGAALAAGLAEGAATAYKAVMKPAEGTILTVARMAGAAAGKAAKKNRDVNYVLSAAIKGARKALDETVNQNPVLKKAGVVDAGGFGYVLILQGMLDAVSGTITRLARKIPVPVVNPAMTVESADFSQFDEEEINFDYCTEFIAAREHPELDPDDLRQYLCMLGDCVVVVEDDEIIKAHVHTNQPDQVLGRALTYGQLLSVKVENMVEQHRKKVEEETAAAMGKREYAAPVTRYGFVAVAAGEGVVALFRELGADQVVEGGQTMNPSTEDILRAIDMTPAELVFVLPNNKNIIMASQQAAALSDKQVIVLPTRTIPQGICAMLSFDRDREPEENQQSMEAAAERVRSGQVTYAARDSEFDGHHITQGDFMALAEGKLIATGRELGPVVDALAEKLCAGGCNFITLLYGEGADEAQAEEVRARFAACSGGAEINVLPGGQPVYSYIVSVE